MLPIIVNVQASGFSKESYPIEVGLVLPEGTSHCFLLSPARGWIAWDDAAEETHGITRETLTSYGRSLSEITWRLNELLKNKTIYSDAWAFDMCCLGKMYDVVNKPQTFRVASLQELMTEPQVSSWEQVKSQVLSETDLTRLRASTNAKVLQQTYGRIIEKAA